MKNEKMLHEDKLKVTTIQVKIFSVYHEPNCNIEFHFLFYDHLQNQMKAK